VEDEWRMSGGGEDEWRMMEEEEVMGDGWRSRKGE
jgi:hypothetical protein